MSNTLNGSSARSTVARPAIKPAFVNSVISVGSRAPKGLVLLSYHPKPSIPSKSAPKPEMLVESAKSAEQAMNSGRP
jgi:hypothetical protein